MISLIQLVLSVACAGLDLSTKTALGFQWQDDPAWLLLDKGLVNLCSKRSAFCHSVVKTCVHPVASLLSAHVGVCMPCWVAKQDALRLSAALCQAERDKSSVQAQLRQAQSQLEVQGFALTSQETVQIAAEQVINTHPGLLP